MSRSMKIAAGILAVLVLYFVGRSMMREDKPESAQIPITTAKTVPKLDKPVAAERKSGKDVARVLVRPSTSQLRPVYLTLKGRTEPARTVTVRSETTGVVASAPIAEGAMVAAGDVLCSLDVESRRAKVSEARAAVTSAELDYKANAELVEKGWKSPNQKAASKATLDRAIANLEGAQIELSKTQIKAPFAGVFETRNAEVGDFLSPGGACGILLDLDPLVVATDASEKYAGRLQTGALAKARLSVGGEKALELEGELRFVASSADSVTRTYRIETALDNEQMSLPAGLTAEVRVQIGEAQAHHISPSTVVYAEDGTPGVRYVGVGSNVALARVEVVDSDADGVWVMGLPQEAQIIVEGQDYVREGLRVDPVIEGAS